MGEDRVPVRDVGEGGECVTADLGEFRRVGEGGAVDGDADHEQRECGE